jgi:hypothetical protein
MSGFMFLTNACVLVFGVLTFIFFARWFPVGEKRSFKRELSLTVPLVVSLLVFVLGTANSINSTTCKNYANVELGYTIEIEADSLQAYLRYGDSVSVISSATEMKHLLSGQFHVIRKYTREITWVENQLYGCPHGTDSSGLATPNLFPGFTATNDFEIISR